MQPFKSYIVAGSEAILKVKFAVEVRIEVKTAQTTNFGVDMWIHKLSSIVNPNLNHKKNLCGFPILCGPATVIADSVAASF